MCIRLIINNVYGVGFILASYFCFTSITNAQPVPDASLPNNSEVNLEENTYQIDGGTVAGSNLFHSFENFSVPTGTKVLFNNNLPIENIISRVTENNISNIDGELRSMGNANLFLINPNGVIFGSNSSLNIGGSFITTTADSLRFSDGIEFSSSKPQGFPLLTISTPIGLKFGNQVGDIVNRSGQLILDSGSSFVVIGGNIDLEGGVVESFPGNLEIGSVSSNSQVNLIPIDAGWTADYKNVKNFQDISLTQSTDLMDGESDPGIILSGVEIQITGKNLTVRDGQEIFVDQTLSINTSDTLKIIGLGNNSEFRSSLLSEAFLEIDGGNIAINTARLIIQDGGQISSSVTGDFNFDTEEFTPATGNGGNISINAIESIKLIDENSGIFSSTAGFGSAGKITINTKDLLVGSGAVITAESAGMDSNGESIATGLGGEIEINASDNIRLNDAIISSSTSGLGDNAGSLTLETNQLNVFNGSAISVSASGSGLAGNLEIAATSINLDRSSLDAETTVGDQGNISLNNLDTLLLRNNSQITTNATELATGGDIFIGSEAIAALDNSDITANAIAGRGGNIQVTTQGIFRELDSEITAASELGIDGTVTFNTPDVDPTSGIFKLPDIPIDTAGILAQDLCRLEDDKIAKGSSFIITGRGGLTSTSESSLGNRDRIVNWTNRENLAVSNNGTVGLRQREEPDISNKTYPEIKQSQGLFVAADGSAWLTVNANNTAPQGTKNVHPHCQTPKSITRN